MTTLTKMINGECIQCSAEETAAMQAEWAANVAAAEATAAYDAETEALAAKYPDLLRAIDNLYTHLNLIYTYVGPSSSS